MAEEKAKAKVEKKSEGIKLEKTMPGGRICRMRLKSEKDITPLMKSDPRIKVVKEWTEKK